MARTLCLILTVVLAACSSKNVWVDSDASYSFAGRSTYAWTEGIPAQNDLVQRRIEAGIDTAFAERGYDHITEGTPDLYVSTQVGGRREVRSTGSTTTVGVSSGGRRGGIGMGTTIGNEVYEVAVGTLIIEMSDGETGDVVWRARAEDTLSNDPDRTSEFIAKAIAKAFEEFPPVGAVE